MQLDLLYLFRKLIYFSFTYHCIRIYIKTTCLELKEWNELWPKNREKFVINLCKAFIILISYKMNMNHV